MIIGLTGQIGSGKTTAAKILKEFGCFLIDADLIGRQVVESNVTVRNKLVRHFGNSIIDKNNKIKRMRLAELAFQNIVSRDNLNSIVHPYLLKEFYKQLAPAKKNHECIVIDAALLLHWNMQSKVDYILVVHAGRDLRLKRLEARGISRSDALAREKSQLTFSEFRKSADKVIYNNKSVDNLRSKLFEIFNHAINKF